MVLLTLLPFNLAVGPWASSGWWEELRAGAKELLKIFKAQLAAKEKKA